MMVFLVMIHLLGSPFPLKSVEFIVTPLRIEGKSVMNIPPRILRIFLLKDILSWLKFHMIFCRPQVEDIFIDSSFPPAQILALALHSDALFLHVIISIQYNRNNEYNQ